jgi:hypothetical protein
LNSLRDISIKFGVMLEGKQFTLNDYEIHRWPEIRKMQVKFFDALMKEVTEFEVETLRLFGLPDIDTIRRVALGQDI